MPTATGGLGAYKIGSLLVGGVSIAVFTGTINTSTTWANTYKAAPGSILIDRTGLKVYINTGTKANPTWTVMGSQS
jgi:hypothetical protein